MATNKHSNMYGLLVLGLLLLCNGLLFIWASLTPYCPSFMPFLEGMQRGPILTFGFINAFVGGSVIWGWCMLYFGDF